MSAATDFLEENTNPDARVPLHPEVIKWCENMAKAARKSEPDEVVAGFDALLELARGGSR